MSHLVKEETAARLRPVPVHKIKQHALNIFRGLVFFEMMKTPDPEKAKALDKLTELRLEIQGLLDVIAPEWAKVEE